ncbi:hypothetical protein ACFWPV_10090 [Streptomyces uncialis]|uniref:hypothetical protein n=1 Tax=Streptomyces uncialis TaxID=1048205 RepID=UPI003647910F
MIIVYSLSTALPVLALLALMLRWLRGPEACSIIATANLLTALNSFNEGALAAGGLSVFGFVAALAGWWISVKIDDLRRPGNAPSDGTV